MCAQALLYHTFEATKNSLPWPIVQLCTSYLCSLDQVCLLWPIYTIRLHPSAWWSYRSYDVQPDQIIRMMDMLMYSPSNALRSQLVMLIAPQLSLNSRFIWMLRCCSTGDAATLRLLRTNFHVSKKEARLNHSGSLRVACMKGHVEIIEELARGFELTTADAREEYVHKGTVYDNEPLMLAMRHNHPKAVEALHKYFSLGRDDAEKIETRWHDEQTPPPCRKSYTPVVEVLFRLYRYKSRWH